MTTQRAVTKTTKKVVVIFDISSSTSILENLLINEQQTKWRNLLIGLKSFLRTKSDELDFITYKFIGDGWILLFPIDCDGVVLLNFISELCEKYNELIKIVEEALSTSINNMGLTFGIDKGTVIYMTMNRTKEYVGRPINIASRLQGSIKDRDKYPQGKVLLSKYTFNDFTKSQRIIIKSKYKVSDVKRNLKNVLNGDNYLCKKIALF